MLLTMFTLLTFARSGVPIRQETDILVSLWHIVEVNFIIHCRLVGDITIHRLDNIFSLDLEEDMIRRQRSDGFLRDAIDDAHHR